jgi:Fe-S oxidoreductase
MVSSFTPTPDSTLQEKQQTAPAYHYHVEPLAFGGDRVESFLTAFAAILRHSNYRFLLDLYARTSTKCGRCAVSCQVYQATGDPKDVPCYRTNLLLDIYRRHFTTSGWLRHALFGADPLADETIDEMAELFYRCTACRRCNLECP